MAEPTSRLYELRLPSLADATIRGAVRTVLARWAPAAAGSAQSFDRTGVIIRLALGDAEAAALLRDLYATGLAPASVVLRPVNVGVPRAREEESIFEIFSRRGGAFVPTWNWRAFIFGPFWYFRRGLYAKGAVLLVLSVCPFFTLTTTIALGLAVLVYSGAVGNWDDYLLKVKGTQLW
jgi:hypothetical protein